MTGREKELQARRLLFKQLATEMLLRDGYPGVTINRIAEITGFSKNTVYACFASKDELIAALGLECRSKLLEAVQKVAQFPGRPRERIVALGEMMNFYWHHHGEDHRILKMIDAEAVLNRVPENQQATMKQHDLDAFQTIQSIVQDAISQGDLVLRHGDTSQGLTFAFWTMMDGSLSASTGGAPLMEIGIGDPMAQVVGNGHKLMDGYGWRPLSSEYDYEATARRARDFLLAESAKPQARQLPQKGGKRLQKCI